MEAIGRFERADPSPGIGRRQGAGEIFAEIAVPISLIGVAPKSPAAVSDRPAIRCAAEPDEARQQRAGIRFRIASLRAQEDLAKGYALFAAELALVRSSRPADPLSVGSGMPSSRKNSIFWRMPPTDDRVVACSSPSDSAGAVEHLLADVVVDRAPQFGRPTAALPGASRSRRRSGRRRPAVTTISRRPDRCALPRPKQRRTAARRAPGSAASGSRSSRRSMRIAQAFGVYQIGEV